MDQQLIASVTERHELGYSREDTVRDLVAAGFKEARAEDIYDEVLQAAGYEKIAKNDVDEVAQSSMVQSSIESSFIVQDSDNVMDLPNSWQLVQDSFYNVIQRWDLLLLIILPLFIFTFIWGVLIFGTYNSSQNFSPGLPLMLALAIMQTMFGMFIFAAIAYIVSHTYQRRVGLIEALKWSIKNIFGFYWVVLLFSVMIFGGSLLFIIPGIIIAFYTCLSVYVFIKEQKSGMQALRRSRELILGQSKYIFIRLFGILFILGIPVIVFVYSWAIIDLWIIGLNADFFSVILVAVPILYSLMALFIGARMYEYLLASKSVQVN